MDYEIVDCFMGAEVDLDLTQVTGQSSRWRPPGKAGDNPGVDIDTVRTEHAQGKI